MTNTYRIGLFTSQDGPVDTYFASEFPDSLSDEPVVEITQNGEHFEIVVQNDVINTISFYLYGSKR